MGVSLHARVLFLPARASSFSETDPIPRRPYLNPTVVGPMPWIPGSSITAGCRLFCLSHSGRKEWQPQEVKTRTSLY